MENDKIAGVDKTSLLTQVCQHISEGRQADASALLNHEYPFVPIQPVARKYNARECTAIFFRDGFTDQYSGRRLVFPGAMRLIAKILPEAFPFQKNWRGDACHFAFYELFPTIDHVVPVMRGGTNSTENLVTTSMLRNAAKANFTLAELGWIRVDGRVDERWDGLTQWFVDFIQQYPSYLKEDPYLRRWYHAAIFALGVSVSAAAAARR